MQSKREVRWKPYRLVLFNFWYYTFEEFYFHNGRILLRGHNGSGKSISMQTLFTFLLDGDKDPKRLDPFGSAARKLYELLLGEESVNYEIQERIGYVLIEYKKEGTNEYLTTGFGLHAKRKNKRLENAWGFVIHNPFRRVEKGDNPIKLYKTEAIDGSIEQIPLNRKDFTQSVGNSGTVIDEKEYADLVNKKLFGFPDVSGLQKFTEVLVHLKSPKLSKESGPTVIKGVLNGSLNPLTDSEISPLTKTVKAMDGLEKNIEQTNRDFEYVEKLVNGYKSYNLYVVAEKAKYYQENNKIYENVLRKSQEKEKKMDENKKLAVEKRNRVNQINNQIEVFNNQLVEFQSSDIVNLENLLENYRKSHKAKIADKSSKEDILVDKESKERKLDSRIENTKSDIITHEKGMTNKIDEVGMYADVAAFTEKNEQLSTHFQTNYQNQSYDFKHWVGQAEKHQEVLESLHVKIKEYEKKKEHSNELKREMDDKQLQIEEYRNKERKLMDDFDEERFESRSLLKIWQESLQYLTLTSEVLEKVRRFFYVYLVDVGDEELKQPVIEEKDALIDSIRIELAKIQSRITESESTKEELLDEVAQLENAKDIEPTIVPDKQVQTKKLEESHIPSLPFYAAVEFKEGLDDSTKSRIESIVTEIGMLTSLIVPKMHYEEVKNNTMVLTRNQQCRDNLTQYFTAVPSNDVSTEDILSVLKGISINDKDAIFIQSTGFFKGAFVEGYSPNHGNSKYIGKKARELQREFLIEKLRTRILALETYLVELVDKQTGFNEKQRQVISEYKLFPTFESLKKTKKECDHMSSYIKDILQPDLESKNHEYKSVKAQVEGLLAEIDSSMDKIAIVKSEKAFGDALKNMNNYLNDLTKLESEYKSFVLSEKTLRDLSENVSEISGDVDILKGDINVLISDISKLDLQIKSVEERLTNMNAAEIRNKIQSIKAQLKELPDESTELSIQSGTLENEVKTIRDSLPSLMEEIQFFGELKTAWLDVLLQDIIEFSLEKEMDETWDVKAKVQYIQNQYGDLVEKKDKTKVLSDLSNLFASSNMSLGNYNLSKEPISYRLTIEHVLEEEQSRIDILKSVAQKEKITLEFNDINDTRRVSPYYLRDKLLERLTELKNILSDRDRELFEDIMINSIGETIKRKIRDAKEWVEKINEFMKMAKNSSGLRFKVDWKPLNSEKDGQMKTNELMGLIEKDPALLSDENKNKISQHFRSKVSEAKRRLEMDGTLNFIDIIKEVLDYRRWYQFTIFYERTGENTKELTVNKFNGFSGGEKALAVYTPLLAAVDARLQSASPEAPRIFALDEAFAGVDDNNIEETFKVIELFDFDYTLNSQALWGCYAEVKHLSIYELYRPGNSGFVTTTRYAWNGINRTRVQPDVELVLTQLNY